MRHIKLSLQIMFGVGLVGALAIPSAAFASDDWFSSTSGTFFREEKPKPIPKVICQDGVWQCFIDIFISPPSACQTRECLLAEATRNAEGQPKAATKRATKN